ncbi:MAG: EpsI family protein [Gammaproteobacteria bacterium]|nr:EpsI family protein [Gammaproteobacteria bacterium]
MLDNMKKDFQITVPAPALLAGAALFIIFITLYWKSASDLVAIWNNNKTYSHGFIIPLITFYLISQQNKKLSGISIIPAPALLIPLAIILVIWLLASVTDTKTVELTLLPAIFIFSYSCIIGFKASKPIIAPLLLLMLAVPAWSLLIPTLQTLAVTVNEFSLNLVGIPTFIQGTQVTIPGGTFVIEGGCSGIRYLVVTIALCSYFSLVNFTRYSSSILFLVLSLLFPILLNWIRIYIIILIGHYSNMQSPLVSDHDTFGWILYGVSLIPLFYIGQKITKHEKPSPALTPSTAKKTTIQKQNIFIILTLALLATAAASNHYINNKKLTALTTLTTPKAASPWLGPIHFNKWHPNYKGASLENNVIYVGSGDVSDIALHIYYYGKQTQDNELINELNTITDNHHLKSTRVILIDDFKIIESIISTKEKNDRIVWHWYHVNNKNTTSRGAAKLLYLQELIKGSTSSSLISLSSECTERCENKRKQLKYFLKKHKRNIISSVTN